MARNKPSALKPTFFDSIKALYVKKDAEVAHKAGVDIEDKYLYDGRESNFWIVLKKHIESLKQGFDEQMKLAVDSGMSEEEIGKRTVMSVLAKGLLDSIINKVEDSYDAVQETLDAEQQ